MIAAELAILLGVMVGLTLYFNNVTMDDAESKTHKESVVYEVGDVIPAEEVTEELVAENFSVEDIPEDIKKRMDGKSYIENDDIQLSDLRYVRVLHYNYDHQVQVGELVVNVAIADDCKNIFEELFANEYEIQSMYLIDRYYTLGIGDRKQKQEASDNDSISANNTSAFNYREVAGTDILSAHGYGLALDVNPLQNPSMACNADGTLAYKDMGAEDYGDRANVKEHMITKDDICYQIFTKYGFIWGGEWNGVLDYQHFEKVQ